MSAFSDFHVHTVYCDGANTPEEMVLAALGHGMPALGFSGHAHTAFDESWCMSRDGVIQYRREIAALRENYAGRIRILCGLEQDRYADPPDAEYDYIIGSVHYLHIGGEYVPVDENRELFRAVTERCFGGDYYAFAEAYYTTVAELPMCTGCNIIGHFDLITKFNEGGCLFDESHPRYTAAWQRAAEELLKHDVVFEVNTGAIYRGYRSQPYPAEPIFRWLKNHGARFILSGDCHSADALCFEFDRWKEQYGL